MALHTLGLASTTALNCLAGWSQSLVDSDIAAISDSVAGDGVIGAEVSSSITGAVGILATGTTHGTTTLDTLVSTGGAGLAAIVVGMKVLGVGIVPGTFVSAVLSPTSVQLSQAASGSAAGVRIAFVPLGANKPYVTRSGAQLIVPRRGFLTIQPGDVVATDNCGTVIIVPGNAISYAGSLWVFT